MDRPEYPFKEFLGDYDAIRVLLEADVGHSGTQRGFERSILVVRDAMPERYPDNGQAVFRAVRFVAIMDYLSTHVAEFDQEDFAVYGSEKVGALVREHLLRAVHEFMTSEDLSSLGHGPTPAQVMERARRIAEELTHRQ